MYKTLTRSSYNCIAIHGDKSQIERNAALEKFKQGKVPIMIGTDVIGRGIDFPNVSYIFNFDTPKNIDDYIHRIGRTGRCGSKGTSISFINENTRPLINDLYNLLIKHNCEVPQFLYNMFYENKGKKHIQKYNNRSNINKPEVGMNKSDNFMDKNNNKDKTGFAVKNLMNNNFAQNNNFHSYDNFDCYNNFNVNSNSVKNSSNYNNNYVMGNNLNYYNNLCPVNNINSTGTCGGIQNGTHGRSNNEVHGFPNIQNLNNEMFYQNYNFFHTSTNENFNNNDKNNNNNDINLNKKLPNNIQNSQPQKTINNNFVNHNSNCDLNNNNPLFKLDNPENKMPWRK